MRSTRGLKPRAKIEDGRSKMEAWAAEQSSILDLRPSTYLLEIGVEELPPGDLVDAIAQLEAGVPRLLDELRLGHGDIRVYGTPRRLAVLVEALAPRQADLESLVKGPPADRAFDAAGAATPAAVGFARKNGVPVEALEVREEGGGRYAFAVVRQRGPTRARRAAAALPGLVAGIKFGKTMRWNTSNVAFSRPIRWFVSLWGETVVPFAYAGLAAGRTTCGPRRGSPGLEVAGADALPAADGRARGDGRPAARRGGRAQIAALAAEVGGEIPGDPALLDEVTDLVEQPTALRGSFEEEYLRLPKEVLITVMKKHQRYFPIVRGGVAFNRAAGTAEGSKMLPYFITVRNGPAEHGDIVTEGNEGVIRARYADAAYFFRADSARPLEAFTPRLATLTFQEKLGSMLDKVHRVERLVDPLAGQAGPG